MEYEIKVIHRNHLHANPNNPRHEAGDVTELARSIRENGILQDPMVIRAPWLDIDDEEHYMIELGYRRWVASQGILEFIQCKVRKSHQDEDLAVQGIVTGLVENLHRTDLTAMEKARAYGRLRKEAHLTQAEIARRVGTDDSSVARYLMLLEIPTKAQKLVEDKKLKVSDAIDAAKRGRAAKRKGKGHKPIDQGWEPDHFTKSHHLAKRAKALCDAREHNNRRRLDGVACGQCFEDAIRQDQTTILQAAYLDQQRDNTRPTFMPPFSTADRAARNGVIGNGS
jgi:ParB family chromosome partitioning protein